MAAALLAAAAPAGGQDAPPTASLLSVPAVESPGAGTPGVVEALRTPAGAFTASLVLPGAGQAALGLRRWPLYLAVEAGLWWLWADAAHAFGRYRDGYRDLAWDAARIQEGPRQDGGWSYYEVMSHYHASGAFDADPAAGVQPEPDPSTYNGSVWEIARGIYLPGGAIDPDGPEYADALAWYEARAAGPGFLWTWVGRESDLDRFRRLIGAADDSRRTQTTAVGVILANHLVSAVDGLIAARLRAGSRPALDAALAPGPGGLEWRLRVRVPLASDHGQDR